MSEILPRNKTRLESLISKTINDWGLEKIKIKDSVNPEKCDVDILSVIARCRGVGYWRDDWSEEKKRSVVKNAFKVQRIAGTIKAIRDAVESLGYRIEITQWYEKKPMGDPGSFSVDVEYGFEGGDISNEKYFDVESAIMASKPLSRRVSEIMVKNPVAGKVYVGAAVFMGDELMVGDYE